MAAVRSRGAAASIRRKFLAFLLAGTFVGAGSVASPAHAQTTQRTSTGMQITVPAGASSGAGVPASSEDEAQRQLLVQAMQMIKSGQPAGAIAGPIAQVIAHYENGPGKDHRKRYYCASSQVEMFLYLGLAAKDHQEAVVLPQVWADAYFEESSALTDLGRVGDSRAALMKALALSPMNSLYLSELGYTYEVRHDNEKALDYFQQAEDASNFSPPDMKNAELAHALRGEGYALTELHRLDEAEAKYHQALKLDPNDQKSKSELEYIARLREKLGSGK